MVTNKSLKSSLKEQVKNTVRIVLVIFTLSGLSALLLFLCSLFLSWLFFRKFTPLFFLACSLVLFVFFLDLALYLTKHRGAGLLFFILFSIFTFNLWDFGIVGTDRILTFIPAGLIFELLFCLLGSKNRSISFPLLSATVISITSIIPISAFLLSARLAGLFPLGLINLILLVFGVSLIASLLTALIWHDLKTRETVIKAEAYLNSLN